MRRKMIMAIILIAILGAAWYFGPDLIGLLLQGKPVPQGETDLRFTEISADFAHHSDFDEFLPFMALSAIDIDNDGIDEIFVGVEPANRMPCCGTQTVGWSVYRPAPGFRK